MSCILCKRTCGIFNIYTIYGNANHTVRDDIVEILGIDSETYLCTTDCVCNVCMNMLENVAKLKWRLQRVLASDIQDCKPINLGKIWELFATFKREDDREDDCVSCLTPTADLLLFSHSRDYNPTLEEQIQIKERNRSLSRASSGVVSEVSEIIEILSQKKKKRRRKGRSRWTHRKRHITSSATSEFSNSSNPFSRNSRRLNDTPLSDCSYISYYTVNKRKKSPLNKENWANSSEIRTRSVSRVLEEDSRCQERLEHMKFYCKVKDCPLYFDDLDVLNHHKIIEHEIMALHYCEECGQRYTTGAHLNIHKRIHSIGPFWCLLCFAEVQNQEILQAHLQQHVLYSVPCKYCDRSFLSKSLRESHSKSTHKDKRQINLYRKKIILDRIDKDETNGSVEKDNDKSSPYQIYMAPFTDVEIFLDELDVTSENMRRMNVDFVKSAEPVNNIPDVVEPQTEDVPVKSP